LVNLFKNVIFIIRTLKNTLQFLKTDIRTTYNTIPKLTFGFEENDSMKIAGITKEIFNGRIIIKYFPKEFTFLVRIKEC